MREKVAKVLEEMRPGLEDDCGSKVELVDVKDGVVSLRLIRNCGPCQDCSGDTESLRYFIERKLKAELYGVKEVIAV